VNPRAAYPRLELPGPAPAETETLTTALGVSVLVAELLARRGYTDADAARRFLHPRLNDLHDPASLPDAEVAVERIVRAIQGGESMAVYGDYDVDGVCSTTILIRFLEMAGAKARPYVPHRMTEGYGLNVGAIERLADDGVSLIITVDNGTTGHKEIAAANERGVDVIVTDHHEPGPTLPDAIAVVNPKRADSKYPYNELCGAGVAFKLAWLVARALSRSDRVRPELRIFLLDALSLVALGTVADVVPLVDENRILVKYGLEAMSATRNPGLRALIDVAGVKADRLKASHLGFRLGPRINAAGRIASAQRAIDLLTTDCEEAAKEIALALDEGNRERQGVERAIHVEARERVLASPPPEGEGSMIVLWGDGWHPGVVGIVAARLVEEFKRPSLVIAMNGESGKGSARSIRGFDLHDALSTCPELMTSFGWHAYAAGMEIPRTSLETLRDKLNERARAILTDEHLNPRIAIDAVVPLDRLNVPSVRELERLGPFGRGNPAPRLALIDAKVAGKLRRVGKAGAHLAFHLSDGSASHRAIAFGMGDLQPAIEEADGIVSAVFKPGLNEWNGHQTVELQIVTLRPGGGT